MTITIGLWIVPAVVTIFFFGVAAFMSRDLGNDRFGAGDVIVFLLFMVAAAGSLLAWLAWALLT